MFVRTKEIIDYLTDYIKHKNDDNSNWYIGICQEAHDIVFEALKRTSQFWMYIETGSPQIAQEVLDHFTGTNKAKKDIRNLDTKDIASVVYVYKKQCSNTKKQQIP
jgi:hypothetical protein